LRALIVFANPERHSFGGALLDAGIAELASQGYEVAVSDLYAMNFNPAAGPADVIARQDPSIFNLAMEQGAAAQAHGFAPDIAAEQEKLLAADLVILQFPMWWNGMPAILKGWIDRVLAYGVAYGVHQWWDKGLLKGRKGMLAITTGTMAGAYAPDGRNGDLERILWPFESSLAICGIDVLPSYVAFGVPWISPEARADQIEGYRRRLRTLDSTPVKFFHTVAEYGPDMRLLPEIEPKTAAQHRG
jgi:NAD(P)H dehydrogenase (quinone)